MNYFKAEVYRLWHSKVLLTSLILIVLYTLFGNYVYEVNDLLIMDLYNHFGEEYLLIFLVLTFSLTIFLYNEDINHHLYYEYQKNKMLLIRFIILCLYLFLIIFISFIFSYSISLLWHFKPHLSIQIITNTLKVMPLIIIYNLILMVILFITKKASYAVLLAFGLYTFLSYFESILDIKESFLKYIFIFNLNFNNLYLKWYYALILLIITYGCFILLIRYLFKKTN